jgi:hypothetical protein
MTLPFHSLNSTTCLEYLHNSKEKSTTVHCLHSKRTDSLNPYSLSMNKYLTISSMTMAVTHMQTKCL